MVDFSRRADEVAPQLLGGTLWHGPVALRLTEVEAYLGTEDPASHAFRGPRGRAATMFGEPGRLYVYVSYGIHLAVNLVCSPAGTASAVLLRSAEVAAGVDEAWLRRGIEPPSDPRAHARRLARLASGPGNLGQVLGVRRADDGAQLGADYVFEPAARQGDLERGPRVGISVAADRPLRFWLAGEPTVSAYRRSPRAAAPPD